jgi:23S rRNA pseudouridine1911/1915/1917 synthase
VASDDVDEDDDGSADARADDSRLEQRVPVDRELLSMRADQVAAQLFGRSRSFVQSMMESGALTVNAKRCRPRDVFRGGELLVLVLPPPSDVLEPQDLPLDILFEDDAVLVVNKAAGMTVHPSSTQRAGTLCNALRFHRPLIQTGLALRPGIVHRLDRETSGVLIVAKHDEALAGLLQSFAQRRVEKWYRAFCFGAVAAPQRIHTGHARSSSDRRCFTSRLPAPAVETVAVKVATTDIVSTTAQEHVTEVCVCLRTGRTHQIRVHLAESGAPVVGDGLYGQKLLRGYRGPPMTRHALHAERLVFPHPLHRRLTSVTAPLPSDLLRMRTEHP